MDKLPDDVTHRINKAVRSMGEHQSYLIQSHILHHLFQQFSY